MKFPALSLLVIVIVCQLDAVLAKGKKRKMEDACDKDNPDSKECSSHVSKAEKYQLLLPNMKQDEKLTKFIDRVIRPTKEFNKRCNEIIDKLVRGLQHMSGTFKSQIKRIVKGGSLGKGTHVKDKSDIDLIIFYNGYNNVQELQADKAKLLTKLKDFVQKDWSDFLQFKDMTPFSVQFYLKIHGDDMEHEVDLLPALDITQTEPPLKLSDIYTEMKSLPSKGRDAYSSCLAPVQVEFVKATDGMSTPGIVKDLIRLLKYWAKEENVAVRSYFLELLVVRQWRKGGKPKDINIEKYLRLILNQLIDLHSMGIAFNDNYDYGDYDITLEKPFLLDPANPFRNVAPSVRDIETVVRKAESLLERMG